MIKSNLKTYVFCEVQPWLQNLVMKMNITIKAHHPKALHQCHRFFLNLLSNTKLVNIGSYTEILQWFPGYSGASASAISTAFQFRPGSSRHVRGVCVPCHTTLRTSVFPTSAHTCPPQTRFTPAFSQHLAPGMAIPIALQYGGWYLPRIIIIIVILFYFFFELAIKKKD